MTKKTSHTVTDFLTRVVLDEAFRELALADPQRAFEGYDMSEEQRQILSAPDERLLRLLGHAVTPPSATAECPPDAPDPAIQESGLPSLPDVELLLELVPRTTQRADAGPTVAYEATLSPWSRVSRSDPTDDTVREENNDHTVAAPSNVAWVVRISPTVVAVEKKGMKVAYSASILPLRAESPDSHEPEAISPRSCPHSPWNHHVDSSAAIAATRAVRDSDTDHRYEKLLDLAHALQTGDASG